VLPVPTEQKKKRKESKEPEGFYDFKRTNSQEDMLVQINSLWALKNKVIAGWMMNCTGRRNIRKGKTAP